MEPRALNSRYLKYLAFCVTSYLGFQEAVFYPTLNYHESSMANLKSPRLGTFNRTLSDGHPPDGITKDNLGCTDLKPCISWDPNGGNPC